MGIGVELVRNMAGMIVAESTESSDAEDLARQLPQKFLLVHAVLEGLAPIDEHDRNFVIELPPQFAVAIHIHFLPGEPPRRESFVRLSFTSSQR